MPEEIHDNWNEFSTSPPSNGSESSVVDVPEFATVTTIDEYPLPPLLNINHKENQSIEVRMTRRKELRSTSFNHCHPSPLKRSFEQMLFTAKSTPVDYLLSFFLT